MSEKIIHVNAGNGYDVIIGNRLLGRVGELLPFDGTNSSAAVVTDSGVPARYADATIKSLEKSRFRSGVFVFPQGEGSKRIATLAEILDFLACNSFTRQDFVLALGGGVVGDIAGLAASLYMRGIDVVQVPTTLLAAVDASVGGKTAVDLDGGKNLVGTFHQPKAVICDCDILRALPEKLFADGMAEVVKCGILRDSGLLELACGGNLRNNLEQVVSDCVSLKKELVERDERDMLGVRAELNLGHTIGHALEKMSGYAITHGEAVAAGLICETALAVAAGICKSETLDRVFNAVQKNCAPHNIGYSACELIDAMRSDKKNHGGGITFALPRKIGDCGIYSFAESELKKYLNEVL